MGNEPRKRMWKVRMRKVGRWIDAGLRNGLISSMVGLSVTKMGLSSQMVIGVIANGVAEAIANGSQRLGLDRREWCCRSHRKWFTTIGFGFGFGPSRMVLPNHREWFCQTVVNGYWRRFGSYRRRWGSTAIGFGSEARRRLGLGVRL